MAQSEGTSGGTPAAALLERVSATTRSLAALALDGADLEPLPPALPEPDVVAAVAALEDLVCAARAAQARLAVQLDAQTRARQQLEGEAERHLGRGVASELALARRESPHRATVHLGAARTWLHEMPHTFAALTHGHLDEWRATTLVRETACLSVQDRRAVDAELCADPTALAGAGVRRLVARARSAAQRRDAAALARRARLAEADRRVTIRPAPDAMTYVTALLPVTAGVALYAALSRAADSAAATGDERGRGQVMADELLRRVSGVEAGAVPLRVNLVMTDRALFAPEGTAGREEPATVSGERTAPVPVPAGWARELVARAADGSPDVALLLRRLLTDAAGSLVALESTQRTAPPGLRAFIDLRDGACRTPWCDAPVRHVDHVVPAARGGPTSAENLQGLCVACNLAKQAPGWVQESGADAQGRPTVTTTSPAGQRVTSTTEPLPGAPPPAGHVIDVVLPLPFPVARAA